MPQASKEMADKMQEYFGDSVSDAGPIQHLQEQGFKLSPQFSWTHPSGKPFGDLTEKDRDCMLFLVEEWDFGGYYRHE